MVVASALLVALTVAAKANAVNAGVRKKGGWQTQTRADGSSFANQGECVSYAARGGTLVAKGQSQFDCESFGGTFVLGTTPVLWACIGVVSASSEDWSQKFDVLADDSAADAFAAGIVSWVFGVSGSLNIRGATDVVCQGPG
jgi:hypothetical protein